MTNTPESGAVASPGIRMERWFCPDCERLLKKPPHREGNDRYHSYRCKSPMVDAVVYVAERKPGL